MDAYLVDGVRLPIGRAGGALADAHPADLAAEVLLALVARTGVDPGRVEDVMFGCVNQIGPQTSCIARTAWLTAGLPSHVPGVTVDRRCGSSLQAAHFAAQAVMSGCHDLVIAGGVESMSMVPIGSPRQAVRPETGELMPGPFATDRWRATYGDDELSQFAGAEIVAERWDLSVEEMVELSAVSHERAAAAWDEGRFAAEVHPLPALDADEGIRRPPDRAKMASLPPLSPGGRLSAAMASQLSDGASAVLVASGRAVAELGLRPLARFHTLTVVGDDPVVMLTGPIAASRAAFDRSGLGPEDVGVAEINEAFAPVVLAVARELGLGLDVVNVNGGAIAFGHPLGATGTRMLVTLAHEMARRGERYGLATMCEGGGQANTTILELVDGP